MFYCLECKSGEVSCDVWLNDLPVCTRGLHHGSRFDGPINQFLIEGMNEICIEITPAQKDPDDHSSRWFDQAPANASIQLSVNQYPFGAIVGGPDAIERASLEWSVTDSQVGTMWPMCKTVYFDIGPGFGEMAWQKADRIDDSDPESYVGILKLLHELHGSLESHDHHKWADLHGARLQDFDRIYDGQPGSRRIRALQELNLDASEGRTMDTLIEDTSAWRICGEGRLIECRSPDGRSPIREIAQEDGNVDYYPVFAGRVNGEWLPLR